MTWRIECPLCEWTREHDSRRTLKRARYNHVTHDHDPRMHWWRDASDPERVDG